MMCSSTCGGGTSVKRPFQAYILMALLAPPSKALLPASSIARHMWTATSTYRVTTIARTNDHSSTRRYSPSRPDALHARTMMAALNRRQFSSLSATDGAKEAAMAAVQAAENALCQEAARAGDAVVAGEVQAAVAAARAAARSAMDALRRDGAAYGDDERDGQEVGAARQEVTSPARDAVEAALSAIAQADTVAPPAASAAVRDAVGMVQAALGRRDSTTEEVGVALHDDCSTSATAGREGVTTAGPTYFGVGSDAGEVGAADGEGGDFEEEDDEEPTREPVSALVTRNNPAGSHSQMSHLLWRQIAGPGDVVVDCTAGNGHDSLELAKIVALKDGIGKMYSVDVQEQALEATRTRLENELGDIALKRTTFTKGNFKHMPKDLTPMSVQLIVYNLGWLPGGDKSITTELEDTLQSIAAATRLIASGGMISVMCYRGHDEGQKETEAVLEYVEGLTHFNWRVFKHERINRPGSPLLLTIYRL